MLLNINATGLDSVPFSEGVLQSEDTQRLDIHLYVSGGPYSASQFEDALTQLAGTERLEWLRRSGRLCEINADQLINQFSDLEQLSWFTGRVAVPFDVAFTTIRGSMGNFRGGHGLGVVGHHPFSVVTFVLDEEVVSDSNSVFYSWMTGRDNFSNRNFVQDCLERAIREIARDDTLNITPSLDRDTQGETGAPDIAATIFRKIARARAFVADVTLIGDAPTGWRSLVSKLCGVRFPRRSPNPNVLVELGYAVGTLGWDKCILVVNKAFCEIEELPFDLRGRTTFPYRVKSRDERQAARESFVPLLRSRLEDILEL